MEKRSEINHAVFWPSLLVVLGLSVPLAIWPEQGEKAVNAVWSFITAHFGWYFLLFGFFCFAVLIWLALGRYGNVKLGGPDEEPEFSTFSWIAMLFAAGIGGGIMMWCIMEPIFYLNGPPFGVKPGSPLAFEWAHLYGMFHWGFSAWAIYCIPTIPIAYAVFVRKEPTLRFSTALRPLLGKLVDGWVGVIIDVLICFGLVGAVGTSLGLEVPAVSAMLNGLFGLQDSIWLQLVIVVIWLCIFGTSVYRGLSKGIKVLSDINLYLAFVLIAFVLLAGPTVFILKMTVNSLGLLLNNFFRMTFWMDPIAKSGFPEAWTVFYWAWWIAYAPMLGLFVARISKGRTIKELVIAECFWGTLGCWLYMAIFGGYSLFLEANHIVPLTQIMNESGQFAVIVATVKSLPLSKIAMFVWTVLIFIFLATTVDSTAYTLASVCTRRLRGDEQPARWHRVIWAIALASVSIGLLIVGGLQPVQLSSIIAALPLTPVLILLIISGIKMLKEDFPHLQPRKEAIDYRPAVSYQQQSVDA